VPKSTPVAAIAAVTTPQGGLSPENILAERGKAVDNEAADLLGISLSTWNSYRDEASVPGAVAMALRALLRDPILIWGVPQAENVLASPA
jgi:hypothetical protein